MNYGLIVYASRDYADFGRCIIISRVAHTYVFGVILTYELYEFHALTLKLKNITLEAEISAQQPKWWKHQFNMHTRTIWLGSELLYIYSLAMYVNYPLKDKTCLYVKFS